MKKLVLSVLLALGLSAHAQKNVLLDNSFWQNKPDVNAVKAEIEKGANPAELSGNGFDPVVMAINSSAPDETIKYLLTQSGNVVTKSTHDGRIYLHWAANRGNIALVEYLISKGSDVNFKDANGTTPMNFAASAGQQDTKLYDLFFAKGVNPKVALSNNGANVLLLAIAADKDLKLTDYFVSKGLDINSKDANGNNAFAYAARAGNVDVLKELVKRGVAVDPNAMLMAAEGSRRGSAPIEVYQYLETLKIKPTQVSKEGRTVLHAAARKPNQKEIIQYFLAAGVDPNQTDAEGNTALMTAAGGNRDTAVIALLLAKTKNINQANKKGLTALTMAVSTNSTDVVRYLIAKGANANVADASGNKLSYYLVQSFPESRGEGGRGFGGGGFGGNGNGGPSPQDDFDAKVKLLQETGIDLKTPQKDGNTLYHLAVVKGDLNLIKRIEKLGVDINAKNSEGLTALHRAAMVSKDDVLLKYLISIGAKTDTKTNFDETAFDLAKENESLGKSKIAIDFLK